MPRGFGASTTAYTEGLAAARQGRYAEAATLYERALADISVSPTSARTTRFGPTSTSPPFST